jgi:hypothetical protein
VAIQNAASVAALLITTEAMVAEVQKKAAAGPAMPPGGGGTGGMDFKVQPLSAQKNKEGPASLPDLPALANGSDRQRTVPIEFRSTQQFP